MICVLILNRVLRFRGRFSIVRKCIEKSTGQEVASKCISKKLISQEFVASEFSMMLSLEHPSLIHPFSLYETPSSHVMNLPL